MHTSTLVRTDALGRVRMSRAAREQILKEFDESGLSGARFAKLVGVRYPTFARWRLQRARSASLSVRALPKPKVQWAEAVVEPAEPSQGNLPLRIVLSAGAAIELRHTSHVNLAAAFLRELERTC
jgi:hypothetical protein